MTLELHIDRLPLFLWKSKHNLPLVPLLALRLVIYMLEQPESMYCVRYSGGSRGGVSSTGKKTFKQLMSEVRGYLNSHKNSNFH